MMKVISLPEIASQIRCRRSGKTFLAEFINQCNIKDAIIIPEGATNGDMLTALFGEKALITLDTHNYLKKWWNAPYKCDLSEKPTGSESEDV